MLRNHSGWARQPFVDCLRCYFLLPVVLIAWSAAARGATVEKANNTLVLTSTGSWVGGGVPGSFDSAQWDSTLTGSNSVSLGGNLALGQVVVTNLGGAVTVNATTQSGGGTLTLNGVGGVGIDMSAATQNLTLNCPVNLAGGQTWNVAANTTLTVSGPIGGSFGVTVAGSGTTVLSGDDNYTGGTTVIGGTLKMNSFPLSSVAIMPGASLDLSGHIVAPPYVPDEPIYSLSIAGSGVGGNGAIVNSSGTGSIGVGQNVGSIRLALAADATIGGTNPWSLSVPSGGTVVVGNGYSLTKTGSNVVTINGNSDAYSVAGVKNINVNAGMLAVAYRLTIDNATPGSIYVNSGGTLGVDAANYVITIQKPIVLAGGVLESGIVNSGYTTTLGTSISLNATGTIVPQGYSTLTLNGTISDGTGSNGIIVAGGIQGSVVLGAANTYSGNTLIKAGFLTLANPLALQASTLDTSGSGSLRFGSLTAAKFGGLTGSGALSLVNGISTAVALSVGNNNANTTYSGVLQGPGSLIKIGGGALALANSDTYSGTTLVSGGTLSLLNSLALQQSTLDTSGSGVLDLGSLTAATLGGLTGSGTLTIVNSSCALTVGNNSASTTCSGTLVGASLTKTGTGTLVLAGSDTYGATAVNQGKLAVNGSLFSPVTVNGGGVLGGSGSLSSATVNLGGHLAPGNSPGTLTLTGSLSLSQGAVLDYDLNTSTTSDEVSMPLGTLILNNQQFTDFNFNLLSGFGPGTYTLIDAGSISGSLGASASSTLGGYPASLAIQGNDLVLNVVPEPSTMVLLGVGMVALWGCAGRRKPRKTRNTRNE